MKMKPVEIKNETKYWLIRPGVESKFFEDFYNDGCVAIGWDKIGKIDEGGQLFSLENLKKLVEEKYKDILPDKEKDANRKIGDIASKIYKFTYKVQNGDIIITPGEDDVLIGRIEGDVEIENGKYVATTDDNDENDIGSLNKIRRVTWIKKINKNKLEPNIRLELRVVHAISEISNAQVVTEINRTLFDCFTYKNEGHSIYKIKNIEGMDFERYAKFISCIYSIYSSIKTDSSKLYIKANFNSPGPVELIGDTPLVKTISQIMFLAFKDTDTSDYGDNHEIVKAIKESNMGENYDDIDFPSWGCV